MATGQNEKCSEIVDKKEGELTDEQISDEITGMRKELESIRKIMDRSYRIMSYEYDRRPNSYWELHYGCRPCAFVCDCCERMCHRCGSGERMWVYGKTSPCDFEKMLCDSCYYNKDKRCPCKARPGPAPIEVDIETGARKTRNKCCKCYTRAYPCFSCSLYIKEGEEPAIMTYHEFLDKTGRRYKYPNEYSKFLRWSFEKPIQENE